MISKTIYQDIKFLLAQLTLEDKNIEWCEREAKEILVKLQAVEDYINEGKTK